MIQQFQEIHAKIWGMSFGMLFYLSCLHASMGAVLPEPVGFHERRGEFVHFQSEQMQGAFVFFKIAASFHKILTERFQTELKGNWFTQLNEATCPICYRSFDEEDHWILTRCHHLFCKPCMKKWVVSKNNNPRIACPICRKNYSLVGSLEWVKKQDSLIEVHHHRLPLHQGQNWIYSPSMERIKALAGYAVEGSTTQSARILDGGWKFPDRFNWIGIPQTGLRLFTRILNDKGVLAFENVDRDQAEELCRDPDMPSLGLLTRKDLKVLRKLLDTRELMGRRLQPTVQDFFELQILGGPGLFWLGDRSGQLDFAFDERLNEIPLPKNTGRATVMCVVR
ncbi:MAG: RING finger protein [Bdellovibrionia bacterium]